MSRRTIDIDLGAVERVVVYMRDDDPVSSTARRAIERDRRERDANVQYHAEAMARDIVGELEARCIRRSGLDGADRAHLVASLAGLGVRALNTLWDCTRR